MDLKQGQGLDLFTEKAYKKGEIVVSYHGSLMTEAMCMADNEDKREDPGRRDVGIEGSEEAVGVKLYLRAHPWCLASRVNDGTMGALGASSSAVVNVRLVYDDTNAVDDVGRVSLQAMDDIGPDADGKPVRLLTEYGRNGYWFDVEDSAMFSCWVPGCGDCNDEEMVTCNLCPRLAHAKCVGLDAAVCGEISRMECFTCKPHVHPEAKMRVRAPRVVVDDDVEGDDSGGDTSSDEDDDEANKAGDDDMSENDEGGDEEDDGSSDDSLDDPPYEPTKKKTRKASTAEGATKVFTAKGATVSRLLDVDALLLQSKQRLRKPTATLEAVTPKRRRTSRGTVSGKKPAPTPDAGTKKGGVKATRDASASGKKPARTPKAGAKKGGVTATRGTSASIGKPPAGTQEMTENVYLVHDVISDQVAGELCTLFGNLS